MNQQKAILIFLLLGSTWLRGQSIEPSLTSSAGDDFLAGSSMLSFSIGEAATASHLTGPSWLTEGFQQPRLIVDAISDGSSGSPMAEITVWPNPFAEELFLKVTGITGTVKAQFYAVNGILVSEVSLPASEEEHLIPTEQMASGTYMLLLSDEGGAFLGNWKVIRL